MTNSVTCYACLDLYSSIHLKMKETGFTLPQRQMYVNEIHLQKTTLHVYCVSHLELEINCRRSNKNNQYFALDLQVRQ